VGVAFRLHLRFESQLLGRLANAQANAAMDVFLIEGSPVENYRAHAQPHRSSHMETVQA
jgi:hypothetical protein